MNKDKKVTIGDMQANDASVKKKCNEASSHPTLIFIHVTSMLRTIAYSGKGMVFRWLSSNDNFAALHNM